MIPDELSTLSLIYTVLGQLSKGYSIYRLSQLNKALPPLWWAIRSHKVEARFGDG